MRNIRVLAAWLFMIFPGLATAGNDAGGGGDPVALEFAAQGNYIYTLWLKQPEAMAHAPELSAERFNEAVSSTLVESTSKKLTLEGREVGALNYPARMLIKVNRAHWFATEHNTFTRLAFVLHEYLGVMGVNDKGYRISSPFLNWTREHAVPPRDDGEQTRSPDPGSECIGGVWQPGRAPAACRASEFGPDSSVFLAYADHIFYDDRPAAEETNRYVTVMHATLKEAAESYLSQKKDAGPEERAEWVRLVLSVAQQESLWSHYRMASDGKLKLHRGDSLHGRGLTGLDDRYFHDSVAGWDLILNLRTAMDFLFQAWEKAPLADCVKQNYSPRARSQAAYSAFNGGLTSMCRWANPKSPYHNVDLNFATNYDLQPWKRYVADDKALSTLNIQCLLQQGVKGCAQPRR